MHHGTCVTHVPWCMSGSLTCGDRNNVPGIPGTCALAILRIWQEAHVWFCTARFYSNHSGLLFCHSGNHVTDPIPLKQSWRILPDNLYTSTVNNDLTTAHHNIPEPWTYCIVINHLISFSSRRLNDITYCCWYMLCLSEYDYRDHSPDNEWLRT